jgi:glycosyltransferase involved in cell wall biosynthesis
MTSLAAGLTDESRFVSYSRNLVRVLLVTDWTANQGGIEAYVLRASQALEAGGHDVRLLTSSAGSAAEGAADYVALGTDNPAAQAFLQIANPFAVARVRAALDEFRPDVVQVNMFEKYLSPAIFLALRGVPTVAFVHYYKPICPTALKVFPDGTQCQVPAGLVCWRSQCIGLAEWLRDRPRYALIRAGLARSEVVLACSRWMAEQLRQNGITAEAFPLPVPPPAPDFARRPAREPLFLYCGRLDAEKGVDLLLRAFGRVLGSRPAARLRILGDGPRRATLEAMVTDLDIGEAVQFDGRVPFAEVEAALSSAWALLAPSIWPEPLGLTAIEAITRGVPAITSASGGFAESVENGVSGYLVPNGDEKALANCLLSAVDAGPTTVPDVAVRTLRHRHDPTHHAERLSAVFEQAVEAHARRHH